MQLKVIILAVLFVLACSTQVTASVEECEPLTEKVCADYSARIVDGTSISRCWRYEQKFKCLGKEINHCKALEDNRGCNEEIGVCKETSEFGICKHFEKKFVCGSKSEERAESKLIDTQFNILKDEKDLSGCNEQEIAKSCEILEEKCIEGAENRNINGKEVYKDCWKWDRKYTCRTDTFIDECKELKERCKEISRECLHENMGLCEHYEVKYQCTEEQARSIDCIASQFCIAGVCETQKRNQHNDFGKSISYLNILAQMKSTELEGCKCSGENCDPKSCKFFGGGGNQCRRYTGAFNCCSEKGFLRGVVGCSQQEKDLFKKKKTGLCHHVGSWRGKGINWYKKKQSYCCFKSRMARIIQVEGRKQLGIAWGDKKSPDCRALTLEEIQRIDFSRIDFSELFNELRSKAESVADLKKEEIKTKAQNYRSTPNEMSELINKKIRKFYEGGNNQ